MSKKKKRKVIAKRKAQAKIKKQKRVKSSRLNTNRQDTIVIPAISEMDPPSGFRALSMAEALYEFAKPIFEFVENGDIKEPNTAMQLAMPLWNYDISQELGDSRFNKGDILDAIRDTLKLNKNESIEFFEMMIQRKSHLFPHEIQPSSPMTMFIRQEEHYLISEFNYSALNFSKKPYVAEEADAELIQLMNRLDQFIMEETGYEEWEDHYYLTQGKCKNQFKKWMTFKGLEGYSEIFPFHMEVYLNFIYRYAHEDAINLKTILPVYMEEFFAAHILRKVIAKPTEFIEWPAALKYFYYFLSDVGYLENVKKKIRMLDEIEPYFLAILRRMYS